MVLWRPATVHHCSAAVCSALWLSGSPTEQHLSLKSPPCGFLEPSLVVPFQRTHIFRYYEPDSLLQGLVNSLKKNIAETENMTKTEAAHLKKDIIKLHDKLIKLDERTDYLSQANDTRFHQLWDMNQEKATEMIEKILAVDKFIHEEYLGLTWVPPDLPKMKKNDLPSYQSALKAVEQLRVKKEEYFNPDAYKKGQIETEKSDNEPDRLLKHILQKISEESQFLIEECLNKLLFMHRKEGKTLVKLDNVFSALGVTKKEDILVLKEYFLPYTYCPICGDDKQEEKGTEEERHSDSKMTESLSREVSVETTLQVTDSAISLTTLDEQPSETSRISLDSSFQLDEAMPIPVQKGSEVLSTDIDDILARKEKGKDCLLTHPTKINTVYVLKALREFISDFAKRKQQTYINLESRLSRKRDTISRLLSTEDVTAYWKKVENIFPVQSIRLWDCLYAGLQKYHTILKERHRLNIETEQLQQQNAELRRLLQSYILSCGNERLSTMDKGCLPSISHPTKKNDISILRHGK